jgi:two-component system phosphate regulon response regulator PhoB
MTILVADDDHVMTLLLSNRLKQAGYNILVAHDAMQATMIAMRTLPDAILLDINMPGGTGMQVLRQLRNSIKTSLIPIIVVSGSLDPEIIANAKSAGADEYFGKPPDLDRLLGVLNGLLHTPNLAKTTDGTTSAHNCTPPE